MVQRINEFAEKDTKVILVGNKIDLPNRVITNEEATKLAREYDCNFLEVSALVGTNVNEIFNSLTSSIYQAHKKHKSEKMEFNEESNNTNYGSNRSKKLKIGEEAPNVKHYAKKGDSCC